MNTQKIRKLLDIITDASVVICNDSPYLHSVEDSEIQNDPENQVLRINWHDDEGYEYAVTFTEDNLDKAVIQGFNLNEISLQDSEGDPATIILYDLVSKKILL